MTKPTHTHPALPQQDGHDLVRAWLLTHRETAELHARLQFLRLMLRLGVRRF